MALSYDASFEAEVAVNDSVVGTVSKKVSLDSYTEAEVAVWDYKLDGIVKEENTIKITQTSGGNLRLDYLSLQIDTPLPMPDLQTATLPEPEIVYGIMNQDHHADEAVDMVSACRRAV